MFTGASSSRRPGRTLVELMVATTILMLLLASCAVALRSASQYHRRISEQTELENSLMMAIGALTRDGAETSARAVAWEEDPPALTFPVPRGENGELLVDHSAGNKLLFGTVVSYRVVGSDLELRRYVDVLPTPERRPPHPIDELSPSRDGAYFDSPTRPFKTLAKGAVEFELQGLGIDSDGNEFGESDLTEARFFRVDLKLERELQERPYAISMGLDIVPRN